MLGLVIAVAGAFVNVSKAAQAVFLVLMLLSLATWLRLLRKSLFKQKMLLRGAIILPVFLLAIGAVLYFGDLGMALVRWTQALNQMRNLVSTAPDPIRAELRGLSVFQLLERASSYRPGAKRDIVSLTKFTLRMLARRALTLEEEISEIDAILKPLVKETAPELVATLGIGTDAASALLVAAGDNPERLRNEAAFAHLCGASPLDASSGKNQRHRLNRSGDRQANSALWHIVLTRMVYDPRTTEYIARRRTEGLTKKEAVRCLKRYVAREVFSLLPHDKLGLDSP